MAVAQGSGTAACAALKRPVAFKCSSSASAFAALTSTGLASGPRDRRMAPASAALAAKVSTCSRPRQVSLRLATSRRKARLSAFASSPSLRDSTAASSARAASVSGCVAPKVALRRSTTCRRRASSLSGSPSSARPSTKPPDRARARRFSAGAKESKRCQICSLSCSASRGLLPSNTKAKRPRAVSVSGWLGPSFCSRRDTTSRSCASACRFRASSPRPARTWASWHRAFSVVGSSRPKET
mmetsp:Transcript_114137/g.271677  ORF Transcript_114137/g.271677 Transcript_114137/m.271677 type:complete len:241 (-) Transcript_114137:65-787(-)